MLRGKKTIIINFFFTPFLELQCMINKTDYNDETLHKNNFTLVTRAFKV